MPYVNYVKVYKPLHRCSEVLYTKARLPTKPPVNYTIKTRRHGIIYRDMFNRYQNSKCSCSASILMHTRFVAFRTLSQLATRA
jgi:hypothetical protein